MTKLFSTFSLFIAKCRTCLDCEWTFTWFSRTESRGNSTLIHDDDNEDPTFSMLSLIGRIEDDWIIDLCEEQWDTKNANKTRKGWPARYSSVGSCTDRMSKTRSQLRGSDFVVGALGAYCSPIFSNRQKPPAAVQNVQSGSSMKKNMDCDQRGSANSSIGWGKKHHWQGARLTVRSKIQNLDLGSNDQLRNFFGRDASVVRAWSGALAWTPETPTG